MRKFLTSSVIFLIIASAALQADNQIEWTPAFPVETSTITITFHADSSRMSATGPYRGDVYAHTGVTTNLGSWQHVIGGWGDNTVQPMLENLGGGDYQLVIDNPRNYYGVAATDTIFGLHFVFRSADAGTQTMDLYLPIYDSVVNIRVDQPAGSPAFVRVGGIVPVLALASSLESGIATMALYEGSSQLVEVLDDTLRYDYASEVPGLHTLKVVATDSLTNADSTEFGIMVNPPNTLAAAPAGVEPGINYIDYATVTLALFAPHKDNIYVIGDFKNNDWKADLAYHMNKDSVSADSVVFWLTLEGLSAGTEYGFQYLVDGELRIADPYADKILDPWNDSYISSATYPGLKPYPEGKTGEIVSVFQTVQTPYNWQHDAAYEKPAKEELVIYELLVREFVGKHDYTTLMDSLDYLENLGINAIELMPINEFEGNSSWGYNPAFYFAPDKNYGPKNTLKAVIDEAHRRDIAVIMDMVINHSYG